MGGVSRLDYTQLLLGWTVLRQVTMPLFVAAVVVPVSASSDTQMGTNLLTGLFFHMLDEMWPLTKNRKEGININLCPT